MNLGNDNNQNMRDIAQKLRRIVDRIENSQNYNNNFNPRDLENNALGIIGRIVEIEDNNNNNNQIANNPGLNHLAKNDKQ